MRIGTNPEKNNYNLNATAYHRIIIPVYIPHFEGYFKEAFEVFQLCIESLLLTIHEKSRITIYNNNCHEEVKKYIDEKFSNSEFIDQVFHSKENLGKINAILAASKGNLEPLITITDADVLFKHDWQKAVEAVFCGFPEAGMVSPVPGSKAINGYTANNWAYSFFRGDLFFADVLEPDALIKFDRSLGNRKNLYDDIHLKKYLVLKNRKNKVEAVMGCGHFVATLRREVFDKGTSEPAFVKIQNGVEGKFIDLPNEKLGYLRLATKNNFAFHMGNTIESWMIDEFEILKTAGRNNKIKMSRLPNHKPLNSFYRFAGKLIKRIVFSKFLKKKCFAYLGLNSNEEY
ncbi:glycosyltransferase family A protein [Flavobacterium sp.]|jgi:hypothetical protein|uniref:glycosyltransferase family A protein n=1 Tax=Flavobacterium sp. TaxID=239 RepID=UPI0037C0FA3A